MKFKFSIADLHGLIEERLDDQLIPCPKEHDIRDVSEAYLVFLNDRVVCNIGDCDYSDIIEVEVQ